MRVAIDARYVRTTDKDVRPAGGIGRYVLRLIMNLLEIDHDLELRLIVPATNGRPIVDGYHGARVTEHRSSAPDQSLRGLLGLARKSVLDGAELFHAPANTLPFGMPCPAVTTIHDLMWLDDPRLCAAFWAKRIVTGAYYRLGIGKAVKGSRQLVAISAATRDALLARFPELDGRVAVVHHGIDPFFHAVSPEHALIATEHMVPRDTPFVLSVGQGTPYKNHIGTVRGFRDAFADLPEVKLVVIERFTRRDRAMQHALADPALRGRVVVLPEVRDVELRALYTRARMFAFPSLCEGFGLPPLEAMACGAPVLTASFGAMAEVCGDAALRVDTRDVAAIARGMRRLHDDQLLRAELVMRGNQRTRAFSWRRCAEETLAVYQRAVTEGQPRLLTAAAQAAPSTRPCSPTSRPDRAASTEPSSDRPSPAAPC